MQQEQSAIETVVLWLNDVIWNPSFIWLCLGVGLFFSIMTRFAQVRHFTEMCRLLFRSDDSTEHGISSFQALSVSLSGRSASAILPVSPPPSVLAPRRGVLDVGRRLFGREYRVCGVHPRPNLQGA